MTPLPSVSTGPASSTPTRSSASAARRPFGIVCPLADPPRRRAERRDPRGDVRALAARGQRHLRGRVGAARDLRPDAHDDVEHEVTERDDLHRLRSSHGRRRRVAGASRPAHAHRAHPVVRPGRAGRRVRGRGRRCAAPGGGEVGPCRQGSARSRARRATASCSSRSAGTARSPGARARRERPSAG